jgi:hypothetical protein
VKKRGEQYVKLPAELIRSAALRNLPQRAFCVVLAILDEHNRHAGKENGNLAVSYKMLKEWLRTSNKTAIALAIKQARALKLIRAVRGWGNKDGKGVPTFWCDLARRS